MKLSDGPYPEQYMPWDVKSQNTEKAVAMAERTKLRNEERKRKRRRIDS